MRKTYKAVLYSGVCLALANCSDPQVGTTQTDGEPAQPGQIHQSFSDLDVDGDGLLSVAESREVPALRNIFSLADRDQDGQLDVSEFSHATLEATRVSADAARGPLFLALDSDENGDITREEAKAVPQLTKSFPTFDVDGNGLLDEEEYRAALDEGLTPEN